MHRAVLVRRLGHHLLGLHVVRHDDAGDGALRQGDAHGAIDHMAHLRGLVDHLDEGARNILEERLQIDFLLIAAAARTSGLTRPTIATTG